MIVKKSIIILHDSLNISLYALIPFWPLPCVQRRLSQRQKRFHPYNWNCNNKFKWISILKSGNLLFVFTEYSYAIMAVTFLVRQHPKLKTVHPLPCPMRLEPIEKNLHYWHFTELRFTGITFSQLNPIVVTVFKYWSNLRRYNAVVFPAESRPNIAICNVPYFILFLLNLLLKRLFFDWKYNDVKLTCVDGNESRMVPFFPILAPILLIL